MQQFVRVQRGNAAIPRFVNAGDPGISFPVAR
jgi:hypothetical protein